MKGNSRYNYHHGTIHIGFMNEQLQKILIIVGLVLAIGFVFGPVVWNEFLHYDDYAYVVDNPHVKAGFTWDTLTWALTSVDEGLWAPLTRLSHMLDVQIFGLHPGGHHFTNLVLHMVNSVLLFLFLTRITGMTVPSALAAAFFALHPLRVEPVAWVASRKDVLSGSFVLLTLLAYQGYVKRPTAWKNALVTLCCLCAMTSKPAAVTLPFGLMLLDYWPYQRYQGLKSVLRLLAEKAHMLVLVVGLCMITVFAEQQGITPIENLSLGARITHGVVVYALYVVKTVIPYPLWIPVMPTPEFVTGIRLAGAAVLLLAVSIAVGWVWKKGTAEAQSREMRRSGAHDASCIVGWLWFLGMLVPTIGLVSFGHHVMADRFTYLPHIGLALALAAAIGNIETHWPRIQPVVLGIVFVFLISFAGLSMVQVRYWHDTGSLFRHTLSVDPNNYVALCNAGNNLMQQGNPEKALPFFQRACAINPKNPDPRNDLAVAYLATGQYNEAVQIFLSVMQQKPQDPDVYVNLGAALLAKGDFAAAREQALKALAIQPNTPKAQVLLEQASKKTVQP
ncbi:MAG TPA: tetratricopeptide repeat protein [Candidatus Hydrogenedentes bacterium]|nr:tetratricopeptide repeat protein [Candidatus Hydrogenedentota bacterium]